MAEVAEHDILIPQVPGKAYFERDPNPIRSLVQSAAVGGIILAVSIFNKMIYTLHETEVPASNNNLFLLGMTVALGSLMGAIGFTLRDMRRESLPRKTR